MYHIVPFETLKGHTLTEITKENGIGYDERIRFVSQSGDVFLMYHDQDCCESVHLEDVTGEFDDLIGHPILIANETSDSHTDEKWGDEEEWTFYTLATVKGTVTLRWYGTSNGYYSTSVYLYKE